MKKINLLLMIVILILSSVSVLGATTTGVMLDINLINQDPDPALAGEIVEIRIGIENVGDESTNNLMLELVEGYPFELVSGEDAIQDVGTLNGYQNDDEMKIIKYKLKILDDVSPGDYELEISTFEEGSLVKVQDSVFIEVKNQDNAEVIHIDKSTLVPGEETSLKFTINNMGNSPLTDLSFKWENEDKIILPVRSDNRKYIDLIPIGEKAVLEYMVIADTSADAGLYELDLTLTYDSAVSGNVQTISTLAGVYVGGGTDFEIAFSEETESDISFTIANIGSNPANSVSVRVPSQEGWWVSGSSTSIIGNLNKGDYTIASFSMTGKSETTTLEIAYTDTMGKRIVVKKEVKVNSNSNSTDGTLNPTSRKGSGMGGGVPPDSSSNNYTYYIIGAVLLLVLYLANKKYKKGKQKNPKYKLKDIFKF